MPRADRLPFVVKEHFVKRESVVRLAIFVSLVAAGALSRIYFRELPNFAPIAAMALFAGYFFRTARVAAMVPLLAMSLSDLVIGGYEWQMMVIVYGALTLPVALGPLLRKYLAIERGSAASAALGVAGLITCSLASSLFFFLATNYAWWPWSMYERNWEGLILCYQQGLPFFRHTLAGDLCFGALLFGSYAVAVNLGWVQNIKLAPVKAVS
jgi:uncharacterized membrane protein